MEKITGFIKNKYHQKEPLKIEWLVVGIISLIAMVFFLHGDTKNLITWSINMLDVTFEGRPFDYYAYSIENPNMAPTPYVSGTLYSLIFWAIWNIPVWVAKQIFGVGVLKNPFVWIWGKMFLMFCLAVTLKFVYEISKFITKDKGRAKWAMFLTASSVFTIIGVFYGGQNDIVICAFATAAVYYLLKKKMGLFYLFAGMAISVKYFFLIPYVAVILLIEKKIFKIIGKVFIGCVPTLVYWGITRFCPMVDVAAEQGSPITVLLKEMIGGAFPVIYENSMSLFIGALLIVYLLSYLTVPENDEEKSRFVIFFIVAASMSMIVFSTFQYYRVVMLCPFIAILMVMNQMTMRISVIMETAFSAALYSILTIQGGEYLFISTILQDDLIKMLWNKDIIYTSSLGRLVFGMLSEPAVTIILQICATVVVVMSLILLVINYPRAKFKVFNIPEVEMERWIYWVRALLVLPPMIYVFMVSF